MGSALASGSGLRPSRSSGPCQGDTRVYPPDTDVMSQSAALRVGSHRALKIPLGTRRTQEAEGGPEVSVGGGHGSQTRCGGRLAMGMWGCVQGPPGHSKGMESTGNRHQALEAVRGRVRTLAPQPERPQLLLTHRTPRFLPCEPASQCGRCRGRHVPSV